jgi:hypothetical protein
MTLKVWNGSAWTNVPYLKVWNGSAWTNTKKGKVWDGSSWVQFFTGLLYDGTITLGQKYTPGVERLVGFYVSPSFGSRSPTTLVDGKTFYGCYDYYDLAGGIVTNANVVISGFSSDPGQSYFSSIVSNSGIEFFTSVANSYSYLSGVASWGWDDQTFGFATSGTTACTIYY